MAQGKRLWVMRASGEMVEYDLTTFAVKQTVKLPTDAVQSAQSVTVNQVGQILFAPVVSLPLSDEDAAGAHKVWFWNGRSASMIDQGVKRSSTTAGSNQAVTEIAPVAYLAADGNHLYWFANQVRRLQREDVDLSTEVTWQAWRTDRSGGGREEIVSSKLPECRCATGTCEESCPNGAVWVPDDGVDRFFLMTQFVLGQGTPSYKASSRFTEDGGKWSESALSQPLQRVLDAASAGNTVVEAIPDSGCCGWSNQSDDQTLVLAGGQTRRVFDEQTAYKNFDYDVSFFTANARLAPDLGSVAMTIAATAQANKPIQLAEDGQANPEESTHIRKALADLPAVEVKSVDESPKRIAFVPHATLVGWISEKELMIVEDHEVVIYNVGTLARRKSVVRVEDGARVFLR